jgi:hypothetical protein
MAVEGYPRAPVSNNNSQASFSVRCRSSTPPNIESKTEVEPICRMLCIRALPIAACFDVIIKIVATVYVTVCNLANYVTICVRCFNAVVQLQCGLIVSETACTIFVTYYDMQMYS